MRTLERKKKRHRHGACLFVHFVGSLLVILVVWSLGKKPGRFALEAT